jgi:hypothetical protein
MPPKSTRRPAANLQPAPSRVAKAPKKSARPARVAPKEYPWDSHQDDIIVETVEEDGRRPGSQRAGAADYIHQLSQKADYEHITTNFDKYRRNSTKEADLPQYDDSEQDEGREWEEQAGIDYTVIPSPPEAMSDYDERIYKTATSNPVVFLAIIRLAQHNLPFLDFDGAISHLPNHPPADALPTLTPGTFAADLPFLNKTTDTSMTILFLPSFYEDTRHALGFYTFAPPAHLSSNPAKTLFQSVQSVVFTPCTSRDLETYDLVEYLQGRQKKGNSRNLEAIRCVGAREGRWLDEQTVEDYEEWSEGVRIVRCVWERRVYLCCGGEEAPGPVQ